MRLAGASLFVQEIILSLADPSSAGKVVRADRRSDLINARSSAVLRENADRLLPYSVDQLFDLAADVERYPEFLRWWIEARVRKREGHVYYTDQVLGLGPIRIRFSSKTVLRPPDRIDVSSDEPPFRRFRLSWSFEARPAVGCRVSLAAELELHSYLLERLVEQVLPAAISDIVSAFEGRACQLYGEVN